MTRLAMLLIGFVVLGVVSGLEAQRFRRSFEQEEPPQTEFIFARIRYSSFGMWSRWGYPGWFHDYPDAEQHINQIMSEATIINVERMSYKIVDMDSPELFKYPFSYISEPGTMQLTDREVENLREYLNRGGFVMVDDFDGMPSLDNLERNLKRVFPERDIFPLAIGHPIFSTFYDIPTLDVTPPYEVSGPPLFYGYPDGKGNLAMIICYNNDVGDFWEWIDRPMYPLKPSTEALRLGINFIVYAMTH